jgi:hypothetical protein
MGWFQQYRLEWIAEMLWVYGYINRAHLMRKFSISEPQAANDFRLFNRKHPGRMVYDKRAKRYVVPDPV